MSAELSVYGTENKFSPKFTNELNLVLEELVTNTISYGYTDDKEHFIEIDFNLKEKDNELEIKIMDDAVPFNPLDRPAPDVNKPAEERSIGGLGIHLVKNLTDNISYRREDNYNILTLSKTF